MNIKYYSLIFTIIIILGFNINQSYSQYCDPSPYKTIGDKVYIQQVYFADQYTESDKAGEYYNDYTSLYTFETQMENYYDMTIQLENYDEQETVGAWIDFNQDEKFDMDQEFIRFDYWGGGYYYAYVYIPSDAKPGNTLMRIRAHNDWWGAGSEPCGDYYDQYIDNFGEAVYGEVEEYTVHIQEPPQPARIISNPVSVNNICTTSSSTRLSISTEGTVTGYQWQRLVGSTWTNISGATGSDYTASLPGLLSIVSTNPLTYSGQFRVLVYSFDGNTQTSTAASVTAYAPATVAITNTQPLNSCEGSNVILNANLGGSYTGLKWQKFDGSNWADLSLVQYPTANTANLAINNLNPTTHNGTYRCIVNNMSICSGGSTVSATINLTVVSLFTITNQPPANSYACVGGDPVNINVEVSGTVLSYQWKKNGENLPQNGTANSSNLVIINPTTADRGTYTCEIRYADCAGQFITTTTPSFLEIFTTFSILQQPLESVVCESETAALSVVATGTIYGYQWQKDGEDIKLSENPYANSANFYLENAKHLQSGSYRCLIDAEDCEKGRRFISTNEVLVYVKRGTEIMNANIDIKAPLGGTATLSIDAHVTPIPPKMIVGIQWYRGTTPLVNDNRIAGAKSSILSIRNVVASDFGGDYWVVVEGLCTSDTARGFVITEVSEPIIIVGALNDVAACEENSATIVGSATVNPANVPLVYQWLGDGVELTNGAKYSGVNTNTLTINNIDVNDGKIAYTLVVSQATKPSNFATSSSSASIMVKELTTINNMSNKDITVEVGKDLLLFIDAMINQNNTIQYQWFKTDDTGAEIELVGETNDTLLIQNVDIDAAGTYSVVVTTECDGFTFPFNVSVTSGVLTVENINFDLMISPNPTTDYLNVNLSQIEYDNLIITNALGEVVYTNQNKSNNLRIDLNSLNLSSGIYFINTLGKVNHSTKFILNR